MAAHDDRRDDLTARLAELVLGVLDPEERSALEAEVAASPSLAAELESVRESLSVLDDLADPAPPSAALRERVLAIPEPARRFEGFVERMSRLFHFSHERAREVLAAIGDPESGWVAPGLPGVHLFHFDGGAEVAAADCGLVQVAPGVTFPAHEHRGDEWSLNLQGRAREDGGRIFEPGDLVHRGPGSRHAFQSIGDEPYVFAVVLYGGFHPEGGASDEGDDGGGTGDAGGSP